MKIFKLNGYPIRIRNTQTIDGSALNTYDDLYQRIAESYAVHKVLGDVVSKDEIKSALLLLAKNDWTSSDEPYGDVYRLALCVAYYIKDERRRLEDERAHFQR